MTDIGAKTFINTATTTQVKTGSGILKRLIVSPGTNFTVSIYDDTDGTAKQMISLAVDAARSIICNFKFSEGLRVVTGGTAGAVTVVWE